MEPLEGGRVSPDNRPLFENNPDRLNHPRHSVTHSWSLTGEVDIYFPDHTLLQGLGRVKKLTQSFPLRPPDIRRGNDKLTPLLHQLL